MASRRGPVVAVVLVAAVLVVAGVGYAVSALSGSGGHPASGSARVTLPTERSHHASGPATTPGTAGAVPQFHLLVAYYLGAGPRGPVLHRTAAVAPPGTDRLALALDTLEESPDVPQYHTSWQAGWLGGATQTGGHLHVDVGGAPAARPAAMDAQTASASLQQVVYTLQAVTHSHAPVEFTRNGRPASSVLGVPTPRPVQARPLAQVMSLMNVVEPEADGSELGRKPFTVSGTGNTSGGIVTVRLELHGRLLVTRRGRMSGSGDLGRLYPWKVVIPLAGLAKGTYQVIASGPDPIDPALTVSDERPLHLG